MGGVRGSKKYPPDYNALSPEILFRSVESRVYRILGDTEQQPEITLAGH